MLPRGLAPVLFALLLPAAAAAQDRGMPGLRTPPATAPAPSERDHEIVARELAGLWHALESGEAAAAEARARAIYREVFGHFGRGAPPVVDLQLLIGRAAMTQSRHKEALELLDLAAVDARDILGERHFLFWKAYAYRLEALIATGDFNAAIRQGTDGLFVAEEARGPQDTVTVGLRILVGRAAEFASYGQLALESYGAAAAALRDGPAADKVNLAVALMGSARVWLRYGRHAEALSHAQEALAAVEAAFPGALDHPERVPILRTMAEALRASDRDAEMRALVDPALAALTAADGGPRPGREVDWSLLAYPVALDVAGDGTDPARVADAIVRLEAVEAALAKRVSQTSNLLFEVQDTLSYALAHTGRVDEAMARFASLEARFWQPRRDQHVMAILTMAREGWMPRDRAAEELFRILQRPRKSGAGEAMGLLAARLAAGGAGETLRELALARGAATDKRISLANATTFEARDRDMALVLRLRDELAALEARADELAARLEAEAPEVHASTLHRPMTVAEVQAALPEGAALVVLDHVTEDWGPSLVLAVTREGVDFAEFAAPSAQVSDDVATLRAAIALRLGVRAAVALYAAEGGAPADFDMAAAHRLHAATLGPVERLIGTADHLLVDLRGPLATLPPQLLLTAEAAPGTVFADADWLVRRHAVTVLPAVGALRGEFRDGVSATEPFLAFADPDYGAPASAPADVPDGNAEASPVELAALRSGLAPLPETAAEVQRVAEALGAPGAVRLGAAASEAAVKAADLSRARVLHFATHGLLAGDVVGEGAQPLREAALALTPGQGEDGFLTVSEIVQLRIDAALVVLSACNTGAADGDGAEALSGLARAFLFAGARGLLVSHWPVESRSAVALMTGMFETQAAAPGLGPAQAQRRAILRLIDAPPDPRWSHPAYWAPFVLVGAPQ